MTYAKLTGAQLTELCCEHQELADSILKLVGIPSRISGLWSIPMNALVQSLLNDKWRTVVEFTSPKYHAFTKGIIDPNFCSQCGYTCAEH